MLSRLAITLQNILLVWSALDSKFLLRISPFHPLEMSFSSDGRFFVCVLKDTGEVHVWLEGVPCWLHSSSATCVLRLLQYYSTPPRWRINIHSPLFVNSFVAYKGSDHLQWSNNGHAPVKIILGFSPSEESAAVVCYGGNTVIILDLQSGGPQITIDTDMDIKCLGLTEGAIVIVSGGRVVVQDLAVGSARAGINDGVRIATVELSPPSSVEGPFAFMSVSPYLTRIASFGLVVVPDLIGWDSASSSGQWGGMAPDPMSLEVYDVYTGRCLADTGTREVLRPYFTPDGCEIWGADSDHSTLKGWGITEDSESGVTNPQPLRANVCPPGTLPRQSSRGYEVTDDGWILSPTQR